MTSTAGGLLPNWNLDLEDASGKPAGLVGVEGIADASGIQFGDSTKTWVNISHPTDTTVSYGFPAIPIDDSQVYTVTVRHKTNKATPPTTGLHLYFCELNTILTQGKTHVGGSTTPYSSVVAARTSAVYMYNNAAYPNDAGWATMTLTYVPTAGTKFASFCMANWNQATTTQYHVDAVYVTPKSATLYRQGTAPSGGTYVKGDTWIDTDATPTVTYMYDGSVWQVSSNYTTNTNQLTDGAGLGTTATWSGVSGLNKPADNANNTYVDASGKIQGVSSGSGLSVSNNEDSVIRAPGGGVFVTSTATMTGRLKITLPQGFTNTMLRFTVEVYEYSTGYMCTLEIGGYNYAATTTWHNVSARVIGGSNVEYPVYFGHDGTKCCIWVGAATNETWSYPQVRVRDFFAGYSNYSRAQWESGWAISFDQTAITSGTGANQYSASVLDTLPGADWAKISGTNKPADGANRTYLDASGQLQGVSGGAGTTVSNSYIGINASGELYGAGAGNGIKVSNNQIYIDGSGAVQGIGSGSGTQVANSTLVPTINAAATTATWSNVSGAGKPADGATSGSNLVRKPTFADGSMGSWGAYSVAANDFNNYTSGNFLIFNVRDTFEVGNDFPVVPGEVLYVGASITTWQSQYTASFGLAFINSSGSVFSYVGGATNPAMTGWVRRTGSITVPTGAVKAVPWFQIDGPGGQSHPVVWGTEFYIGRQQEGATVGMSEIESSTGLTSINGWSLNKNGSFKAVGSGNSIQVSPNAASISFTKPDGNAAFFVNESGSALFGGSLTAATGTFAGTLAAGVLDSASFDSIKYVYPNSGNYGVTVPAKKAGWASLSLKVTMVGAGGGGGGGAASGAPNRDPTSSGGGGGAGQKSVYTFNNLSSGAVIPITVGAGGAGGGANTTWNGSSVSGGSGGSGGSSGITVGSNSYYASGGTGGGAGTSALADDFGYFGNGTGGGAGGSLGGSPGSGGFRISAAGGAGGSSEFGNGGGGGSASYRSASAGGAGSIGAGGGGGGADASDAGTGYAGNGGAGGSGYILFEFYDPNTVVLNGRYSALISWLDSIGHGAVPSNAR